MHHDDCDEIALSLGAASSWLEHMQEREKHQHMTL